CRRTPSSAAERGVAGGKMPRARGVRQAETVTLRPLGRLQRFV
ncbi:MAG: hypothetical protein AVDCRST_MAG40-2987, partial [uncultured Gemmatimonadaceae bacterium]